LWGNIIIFFDAEFRSIWTVNSYFASKSEMSDAVDLLISWTKNYSIWYICWILKIFHHRFSCVTFTVISVCTRKGELTFQIVLKPVSALAVMTWRSVGASSQFNHVKTMMYTSIWDHLYTRIPCANWNDCKVTGKNCLMFKLW
jgi:hypothetical protein